MVEESSKFKFRVSAQPLALFETPIIFGKLEGGDNFIDDVEAVIRQRMSEDQKGIVRSNQDAWHSDTKMLVWGGPVAKRLGDVVISMAKRATFFADSSPEDFDWALQMWANVTPKGGQNAMHVHTGNLWAAVLYIDMGDEPDSETNIGGEFYVEDPRFPMNVMRNTGMRVKGLNGQPQNPHAVLSVERGQIIMFPAWLRHGVRPYAGSRERISVAINIDAQPKHKPGIVV